MLIWLKKSTAAKESVNTLTLGEAGEWHTVDRKPFVRIFALRKKHRKSKVSRPETAGEGS